MMNVKYLDHNQILHVSNSKRGRKCRENVENGFKNSCKCTNDQSQGHESKSLNKIKLSELLLAEFRIEMMVSDGLNESGLDVLSTYFYTGMSNW